MNGQMVSNKLAQHLGMLSGHEMMWYQVIQHWWECMQPPCPSPLSLAPPRPTLSVLKSPGFLSPDIGWLHRMMGSLDIGWLHRMMGSPDIGWLHRMMGSPDIGWLHRMMGSPDIGWLHTMMGSSAIGWLHRMMGSSDIGWLHRMIPITRDFPTRG